MERGPASRTMTQPQRQPSFARPAGVLRARCTRTQDYTVHLVDDVLGAHATFQQLFAHRRVLVVAPRDVWAIHGARLRALATSLRLDCHVLTLDMDEASKSIANALVICDACVRHEIGRTDVLLAFGGGVCCDLVTVAASLVRRGIAYVCIPTTLVGMIDAGIGIKGAVNHAGKKSYLGSFYPPETVLIDPSLLATAPPWSAMDGMAEAIKIALIRDAELFALIEAHGAEMMRQRFASPREQVRSLLLRSIDGMLQELGPNFFEDQTYNRKVDFGHTISGLLEERSAYRLSHGHAVAIDMALCAGISVETGHLRPDEMARILRALTGCGLPVNDPLLTPTLCEQALHAAALHRGGAPRLVAPDGIGEVRFLNELTDLPPALVQRALAHLPAH